MAKKMLPKQGNRPARNPGGMECQECGEIFIGEEWHCYCGVCIDVIAQRIAAVQSGNEMANVSEVGLLRAALSDCVALLLGEISGDAQRSGIIREAMLLLDAGG